MDEMESKSFPLKGFNHITETTYNEPLKLFEGTYLMENHSYEVFIWKGDYGVTKMSYDALRAFRHPIVVDMLDFYSYGDNEKRKGCIIIPKVVNSPFQTWLESEGKYLLFDEKGRITPMFRNIVIALCDAIENLMNMGLSMENLRENLYIQNTKEGPKLLILPAQVQVEKVRHPGEKNKGVKAFMDWCITECNVNLHDDSKAFANFLVSNLFTLEKLKGYPDNWDYIKKGNFLHLLIALKQNRGRSFIKSSGIKWPLRLENQTSKNKIKLEDLTDLIVLIVKSNDEIKYKFEDPYDHFRLLRHSYKHYDELPDSVKDIVKNKEGLIRQFEQWTPNIWSKVYEHSGPLGESIEELDVA